MYPDHYSAIRARFPDYILWFRYPDNRIEAYDSDANATAQAIGKNATLDANTRHFTLFPHEQHDALAHLHANPDTVVKIVSVYPKEN